MIIVITGDFEAHLMPVPAIYPGYDPVNIIPAELRIWQFGEVFVMLYNQAVNNFLQLCGCSRGN